MRKQPLRTSGGDTTTAFNIVNLIKQYIKEFNIIIPTIAHSAGTLLSLGASQLLMTKQASLSPFDPSVRNNHINDGMNISWRDLNYFLSSARENYKWTGASDQTEQLKILIENQIHPLLIRHAERTVSQIRSYVPLLIDSNTEVSVDAIFKHFLEPNTHHNFRYYRDEVKNLGLNVVEPNKLEEELILKINDDIVQELDLNNNEEKRGNVKALIESSRYGKTLCINTNEYKGWIDEN